MNRNPHVRQPLQPFADPAPPLSEAGQARRETMRVELERAVRARPLRRAAARGGAAAALLLAAALLVSRPWAPANQRGLRPLASDGGSGETAPPPHPAPIAPAGRAPARLVAYVTDSDAVLSRYAAVPAPSRVEILDDRRLLETLREAGLPAGIVRTPDRLALAFHGAERADATP